MLCDVHFLYLRVVDVHAELVHPTYLSTPYLSLLLSSSLFVMYPPTQSILPTWETISSLDPSKTAQVQLGFLVSTFIILLVRTIDFLLYSLPKKMTRQLERDLAWLEDLKERGEPFHPVTLDKYVFFFLSDVSLESLIRSTITCQV